MSNNSLVVSLGGTSGHGTFLLHPVGGFERHDLAEFPVRVNHDLGHIRKVLVEKLGGDNLQIGGIDIEHEPAQPLKLKFNPPVWFDDERSKGVFRKLFLESH